MDAKRRILVIEDEEDIVLGLKEAFSFEGFEVVAAPTGEKGISMAADLHPDLIILDLMLPDTNGYKICEQVRRRDKVVPILILSARSLEADIIRGLEAGADDYVTKPFSLGELLARVRTIFRRSAAAIARPSSEIAVGEAVVNVEARTASIKGRVVQLGFYEASILQLLDEHRGEVVSRDQILDTVWGIDESPTNRTVDNFILKLRRKLEPDPQTPRHIVTVYGHGYKLV
ncbi:MAG: response regulator transcription factor [Deltaproteobacteria bacterium]|nr:response regulator transcription factor [Deltaproteobacteria bacterium]